MSSGVLYRGLREKAELMEGLATAGCTSGPAKSLHRYLYLLFSALMQLLLFALAHQTSGDES